ncbi:MAG: glycosyltransferase family 4 protein [Planctomycetota bacterium]
MSRKQNRLLILSENFPPVVGGSARWAGKIAEYWPGRVDVLMAGGKGLAARFVGGHVVSYRRRFVFPSWGPDDLQSCLGYFTYVGQAVSLAIRRRPGWILVGRGLPEGVAAMTIQRLMGVPYAVLAHGEEIATCQSSGLLRRMLASVYGRANLVIANSLNSRHLAMHAGACEAKTVVSHPGVDTTRFSQPVDVSFVRRELGIGDEVMVLSVGRLEWRKNHRAVVNAVKELVQRGRRVAYVIAGSGEEEGRLTEQVRRLGIESSVRLLGRVSDEQLVGLFRSADVFALPGITSKTQFEGFGIVFLEAAAAGVPSICGNAGGSPEAVIDGETGLVVDGSDATQVQEALERLVTDESLRGQMGRLAQTRVMKQFDWSILMSGLFDYLGLSERGVVDG